MRSPQPPRQASPRCPSHTETAQDVNARPPGKIVSLHSLHHSLLPVQQVPGIDEALHSRLLPGKTRDSPFPGPFRASSRPSSFRTSPVPQEASHAAASGEKSCMDTSTTSAALSVTGGFRIKNRLKARFPEPGGTIGGYAHPGHGKAAEEPLRARCGKGMVPFRNVNQSGNPHGGMVCFLTALPQDGTCGSVSRFHLPITL